MSPKRQEPGWFPREWVRHCITGAASAYLTQRGLSLPKWHTTMPCPHWHAGGRWSEAALMLGWGMTKHGMRGAQVLAGLGSACSSSAAPAALRTAVQRQVVIGLFRDLRGITMATNSRRTYGPPCSCACDPPCMHCIYARTISKVRLSHAVAEQSSWWHGTAAAQRHSLPAS